MTLPLLACEDFKRGEARYATTTGVWKLSAANAPEGAFLVRADRDVRAGKHGEFVEMPRSRFAVN